MPAAAVWTAVVRALLPTEAFAASVLLLPECPSSALTLEVLDDLAHEPLKRQLAEEQLRVLLVLADLTQRHRAGPVAVRLFHTAGGGRALPRGLLRQLLARRLAAGRLARGLLRVCHP